MLLQFIHMSLMYMTCVKVSSTYDIEDHFDAMEYLTRFGYMEKSLINELNIVDMRPYISAFQHTVGINESGQLDQETLQMMNKPRCGCLDMPSPAVLAGTLGPLRTKRFAALGSKWSKRELVYRITHYSHYMTSDKVSVEKDVDQAFKLWESVTDLEFIKAVNDSQQIDIELQFWSHDHQDSYPFDGPGSTLAHAFAPGTGLGGDVHYDAHEDWTTGSSKGTNVLYVSVHEIGHALGLAHSSIKGSIMQAIYGGYRPNLKLHDDDIQGIQRLYGSKPSARPSPRVSPPKNFPRIPFYSPENRDRETTTTRRPWHTPGLDERGKETTKKRYFSRADICQDPKLDAITTSSNGAIYLFKGRYVYQIDSNGGGLMPDWPNRIEYTFKGLHSVIDAALTRKHSGSTYFFKHDKYWRFNGTKMDANYPKEIARHFPSIPDNLDAAFEWPTNGHMYFFKGDKYWSFNPRVKPHVSSKYPLPISNLGLGLEVHSIDGAFVAPHGKTYLFSNNEYWRLDDDFFRVAEAIPPYPRDSRLMWWGCTLYKPEVTDI